MGGWGIWAHPGKGVAEASSPAKPPPPPPLREGGGSGLTPQGKGRLGLLTCRILPCRIREGGASGLTQGKGWLRPPHLPTPPPLLEGGGSGLTQGKGWLRLPHLPNTALQDPGGWGIWAHPGKGEAEIVRYGFEVSEL